MSPSPDRPRVMVFAPSPLLTVTIETKGQRPDVHLHAGGQGFWVARMAAALGADVRLCGSFGGETGGIVRSLMEQEGVTVVAVGAARPNAAYVHDRRSGRRVPIAEMEAEALSRHEVDELYSAAVVEGMDAEVCVLGGPSSSGVLPPDIYRRLVTDLTGNGRIVVADLSGPPLDEVVAGKATVVKSSHEDLRAHGHVEGDDRDSLVKAMTMVHDAGVAQVVVSRAEEPALALIDGEPVEVHGPRLEPQDTRGAGDSMTAGVAVALARGDGMVAALRLGAAAGSLNVIRKGLATGKRGSIERLADRIEIRPLGDEARAR